MSRAAIEMAARLAEEGRLAHQASKEAWLDMCRQRAIRDRAIVILRETHGWAETQIARAVDVEPDVVSAVWKADRRARVGQ